MDISGLDILEVSRKLQPYIEKYFAGCELSSLDDGMFGESYLLHYDEVEHLIPNKYRGEFIDNDRFNGASGCLDFVYQAERFKDCEYTVMLLTNENFTKSLFLYVQEDNPSTGINDILIMDFMKQDS